MPGTVTEELGLPEAALRLRRSRDQTMRLVLRGELEGRKVGTQWRISAESVERVQRQTTTAA